LPRRERERVAGRYSPAVHDVPKTDQRTRRSTGVLPPVEQQLYDQHHTLRERRRPQGPVRHSSSAQRPDDSYLYHSGRVDTTLPFDELRRRSQINEAAQAANDAPYFSERIRASLPTIAR
jgi:hypothetical protein